MDNRPPRPIPPPPRLLWRRLSASAIDVALLSVPAAILCVSLFEPMVRLGPSAELIGFLLTLAYATFFDARGATPGKRVAGLRVSLPDGRVPGLRRALVRNLVRVGPWFLTSLWTPRTTLVLALSTALWAGVYLASALLVVFDPPRRALHDLLAGTHVTLADKETLPVPSPGLRTAALLAAPLALALVAARATVHFAATPLTAVFDAVAALPSDPTVQIAVQTSHDGNRENHVLNVSASFTGPEDESPAFAQQVVERVRSAGVSLQPYQALRVGVSRRATIGLGSIVKVHTELFPIVQGQLADKRAVSLPQLALEGPETWTLDGSDREIRSWFVESKSNTGERALLYVVEWNCPKCEPQTVSKERAQQLAQPLFAHICQQGLWKRHSLSGDHALILASQIAVQLVDRSAGSLTYPRYGVLRRVSEACPGS